MKLPVLKPLAAALLGAAMTLTSYQGTLKNDINSAWEEPNVTNVLAVLATGGGKTVTLAKIVHEHNAPTAVIAHRQELVGQISMALAREGVRHKIIAPAPVIKQCVREQMQELDYSAYDPNSVVAVAGVSTILNRKNIDVWRKSVTLWIQDESHHVLENNQWGRAAKLFENAKGLGLTATPCRADGKGLGRHAHGIFDKLVLGPNLRELIDDGYLTDYRIIGPPAKGFNREQIRIGASGEMVSTEVVKAVKKSKIIGDVVEHYLKFAEGKLGVTFVPDVETAEEVARQFNVAGVPALALSGNSSTDERIKGLRDFKNRKILQLVNCDLFGEGFDLPAIEVVSMARPTASYALYSQQFGRALRLMVDPEHRKQWHMYTREKRLSVIVASKKPQALIIDHVGNVDTHKLPDFGLAWTLDAREARGIQKQADDRIPLRTCQNPECYAVYERTHLQCPYCGHTPQPASRVGPEYVDGDLVELDAEALAELRGAVAAVDRTPAELQADLENKNCPRVGVLANVKRHKERQVYQASLREIMAIWMGHQKAAGYGSREAQRLFYFKFGMDVLSAQALKSREAEILSDKILNNLVKNN